MQRGKLIIPVVVFLVCAGVTRLAVGQSTVTECNKGRVTRIFSTPEGLHWVQFQTGGAIFWAANRPASSMLLDQARTAMENLRDVVVRYPEPGQNPSVCGSTVARNDFMGFWVNLSRTDVWIRSDDGAGLLEHVSIEDAEGKVNPLICPMILESSHHTRCGFFRTGTVYLRVLAKCGFAYLPLTLSGDQQNVRIFCRSDRSAGSSGQSTSRSPSTPLEKPVGSVGIAVERVSNEENQK